MKKFRSFISSMRFAVILLLVLIAACVAGSLIPQGNTLAEYTQMYSQTAAAAIVALGLDDVFHVWWFVVLTAFLCINLIMCNITRAPSILRRKKAYRLESRVETARRTGKGGAIRATFEHGVATKTDELFQSLGFRKIAEGRSEGTRVRYASRHLAGLWGAWICHLGILILILGFGFGQAMKTEYTVYGVPGQSKTIGDTSYVLTVDDFQVDLREDDTVEQYTGSITVHSAKDGSSHSAEISVNNPADMYGMRFYQNAMGWAATMHVADKDGEEVQTEVLCQSEMAQVEAVDGLVIWLRGVYPDYVVGADGMPATASDKLVNPGYLYQAMLNGQTIGMNVLYGDTTETNEISIDQGEYFIWFDEPQYYTLVQIKRDPFTPVAFVGGLIVMLGLILAFYMQPSELLEVQNEDGSVTVYGNSRKGGALFAEEFRQAAVRCGANEIQEEKDR